MQRRSLHRVRVQRADESLTREFSAADACQKLIRNANSRGTGDNLTVAFFKQLGETPEVAPPAGLVSAG